MAKTMMLTDSQAATTHGWKEFRPTGLVFYRDGGTEAVWLPDPHATVRDVVLATGRAARAHFRNLSALGVICAAWASRQAVTDPGTGFAPAPPAQAPDRKRARVTYAVDVEGTTHTFTNVDGLRHYEYAPVRDCDPIPAMLSQVLAEATFTSRFLCATGSHVRTPLL